MQLPPYTLLEKKIMYSDIIKKISPIVATTLTCGSLVFQAGRESSRVDELFTKAYAADIERKSINELLYEIHGKVSGIERDIHYIKKTVDVSLK